LLDGTEVARNHLTPAQHSGTTSFAIDISALADGVISLQAQAFQSGNRIGASNPIHIQIDRTAPSLSASLSPLANSSGWNNSNVTVHYTASDSGSGVASVTGDQLVSAEGTNVVTGTALDNAGNSATTNVVVKLDKTQPSITPTLQPSPNSSGWNNSDVTVSWTATDALSGVDPSSVSSVTSVVQETSGQTVSGSASDLAGNTGNGSATVKLDKTAPSVILSPANGSSVTNAQPTFTAGYSDALSGISVSLVQILIDGTDMTSSFSVSSSQATYAPSSALTDGNHTWQARIVDNAGNTNTVSSTFAVVISTEPDTTPPDITATITPTPNAAGWNTNSVTVHFSATDTESGVAYVTSDVTVTNEAANQEVDGIAIDNAGNTNSTSVWIGDPRSLG
jgi:hypothetical protein